MLPFSVKAFPHPGNSHTNDFSPVCRLRCALRLLYFAKFFPHISHGYILLVRGAITSGAGGDYVSGYCYDGIGGTPKPNYMLGVVMLT